MSVLFPSTIGGTIAASDSDSISTEIDVSGLPIATKAYNLAVGAYFTLTVSTASLVTDEVLAVLGTTGLRWIVDAATTVSVSAPITGDGSSGDPVSVANASESAAGAMTAADKIIVDGISFGSWAGQRRKEMAAVVAITEFQAVNLAAFPASTTAPTFDAGVPGCGISPGASSSPVYFGRSCAQTIKSGIGGVVFDSKFGTPTTTDVADVGLINAASSQLLSVRRKANAVDTHYFLQAVGGGTTSFAGTVVADNLWHNFMLAWNATNVRLFVDNVLAYTLTDLTNVLDATYFPYLLNSFASQAFCRRYAFGYIPA